MSIRSNPIRSLVAASTISRNDSDNKPLVLNLAGGFLTTLPKATGSGQTFKFIVGTLLTSSAYAVAVNGTDLYFGGCLVNDIGDSAVATADFYPTASTTNRFTMTASIGAGKIGDWVEFTDFASGKWAVRGSIQGEVDPATPFSNV